MSYRTLLIAAAMLTGCAPEHAQLKAGNSVRIDHVIVGTSDLDLAVRQIAESTGVRPVFGGAHPGRGTRNALIALGDGTYLELLAPDPAQAVDNEELGELRALSRPTPVGWAVSADNEAAIRSALAGADVATSKSEGGSRVKPDGAVLRWTSFGYAAIEDSLAPFFIVWAKPASHPSRTSPTGCRLTGLRIEGPEADSLRRAITPLRLDVTVDRADRARMHLSLSCPKGAISL